MDIVAYTFESAEGRFTVRLRATHWWRIKLNGMPYGEPHPSAQHAVDWLSQRHGVPARLAGWQAEESYESRFSET